MIVIKIIGLSFLIIAVIYVGSRIQMAAWIDVIEKRLNNKYKNYEQEEKK